MQDQGARAPGTLGSRLRRRDRGHLVGRREQLAAIESLFVDDPPASVVFLHGPGGIGKSTLLREAQRRGESRGWTPFPVEGRELPPLPDAMAELLTGAAAVERPLILIDSFEFIEGTAGFMRRELLPSLPELAIVVVASREAPDRGWFEGGWEGITLELRLPALSDAEAAELLGAHGISGRNEVSELIGWAEGSPLALVLAADASGPSRSWSPRMAVEDPRIVQAVIQRLTGGELDAGQLGALDVAAVARSVTPELLTEVTGDGDPTASYEWLASRSFTESLGEGIALHDLVGKAMEADLRRRDPERERRLRREIADHLHARAVDRNLLLSIDLMHLVKDDATRWGYAWQGRSRYRIDDLTDGDAARIEELLAARGHRATFELARRFFDEAPQRVAVARDSEERLCGYQVSVTPVNAPAFAADHPLLGPWLDHARTRRRGEESLLWSESIDFSGDPGGAVQSMLGMAGVLRSGLRNPRYAYMPIDPRLPGVLEFCAAVGADHIPELDGALGGVAIQCHVIDYGAGGLLDFQRDTVYAELGLGPPPAAQDGRVTADDVRDALRNLDEPVALASSPLASGTGVDERAESVRVMLREAAAGAFGDGPDEHLLQEVLTRGYLDPAPSRELAADELHLSRSSYFRRLRTASLRVAEYVAAREGTRS